MPFVHTVADIQLEGKSIIIPVVSTANVAQLAVDIIISSFSLQRIAIFSSEYFVPVVGAREDGQKGITTALELYGHPDVNFVVVQQRSPALKSRKGDFIAALLDFVKSSRFGAALFLSGVDLSNRTDSQMITPTYQIRPEHTPSVAETPLRSLSSLAIPTYTSPVQQSPPKIQETLSIPFIPGGGLTRRILSSIPNSWSVPTAGLLQFVLEGDNRADAGLLAAVVVKVLGKSITEWKQPGSWRDGLFGTPADQSLYG